MVELETEIAGITLKNPLGLGSSRLGYTGSQLVLAAKQGFGFVVTKSISIEPREGYESPCIYKGNGYMLNAEGLPNLGMKQIKREIAFYNENAGEHRVPLGVSIFGSTPRDFETIVEYLDSEKFEFFELNLSCPHSDPTKKEACYLIGQDPDLTAEVVEVVRKNTGKPIFVKLTPSVLNISYIAKCAVKAGADVITATNTMPAMDVTVNGDSRGKPVLSNTTGGLSGHALLPISLKCVYNIRDSLPITPIVGVGGICHGEDIVKYFFVGANAVQAVSVFYNDGGYNNVRRILDELKLYMIKNDYYRIKDMAGLTHKKIR
ncbi:MAG: tRNA-dihydrouridine synthase [Candidatus Aenigmarchaeota archaeon]|nr:tRNA-dihydrouridine synthase [Candidatus Aenigmarchaeota archaeon]